MRTAWLPPLPKFLPAPFLLLSPFVTSVREIISDEEAYLYIKRASRDTYKDAWENFRISYPDIQDQFEERTPSEKES